MSRSLDRELSRLERGKDGTCHTELYGHAFLRFHFNCSCRCSNSQVSSLRRKHVRDVSETSVIRSICPHHHGVPCRRGFQGVSWTPLCFNNTTPRDICSDPACTVFHFQLLSLPQHCMHQTRVKQTYVRQDTCVIHGHHSFAPRSLSMLFAHVRATDLRCA